MIGILRMSDRISPRKYLTGPQDWWAAFEAAAAAEGISLSEWAGEGRKANLPANTAKSLSERPGVGPPRKIANPLKEG